MKKIGIFGGAFNPPHIAHSIAAQCVQVNLSLDKILFIPAGNHPLKESISAHHRLSMAKLAFEGNKNFEVSDIEIKEAVTKSYTVNTLEELRNLYGTDKVKFFLIIGIDNFLTLDKWKEPERLFELSEVVVINRPGFELNITEYKYSDKITNIKIPYMEISSSYIRDQIKNGHPTKYLVSEKVEDYILKNGLYIK